MQFKRGITDKRTKIITTLGPATEDKAILESLFDAGMSTVRLNFSHGNEVEQGKRIKLIKEIAREKFLPISVLLDTKGPEIRVGQMKDGAVLVEKGQEIIIYSDENSYKNKVSESGEMTVSYDMSKDLKVGKMVLVDDGKLRLKISDIKPGVITTIASNTHKVKTNKRINLPGTKFTMPFLSEKDRSDIRYGCDMDINYVAASFVNTPGDLIEIKHILKEKDAEHIKIISKIESQYAVDHFDEILKVTDGVMIARGDLGLEIPFYEVPVVEKMIIRKCREVGKPVIVATQMLDSMESSPQPTRAEVTDVYYAVELGADSTMLSGETAAGSFPIEAVDVMSDIACRAEKEFYNKLYYPVQLEMISKVSKGQRAEMAKEVAKLTQDGDYKFTIVTSATGRLLLEVSKFRPNTAIIGVTRDKKQIDQFGIVSSVFMAPSTDLHDEIQDNHKAAEKILLWYGAQKGDKYLIVDHYKVARYVFE